MKKYLLLVIAFIFIACKETAFEHSPTDFYFDQPQPANDSELTAIPSRFTGTYNLDDTRLTIGKNIIYSETFISIKESKDFFNDSLKEEFTYSKGRLIAGGIMYNVIEENDSLTLSTTIKDTLFRFSPTQKAKRIGGNLVLSHRDLLFWKINILTLRNDSLIWKHPSHYEDYTVIKDIIKKTSISGDSAIVHMKPNRAEFRKLLKLKRLGWEKGYAKIK